MAKMKKRTFEREYVQIPNETAKAPEIKTPTESISLEALGLLVNLWSYDLEKWEVHKTELYKRFAYNKETSVKKCWNELIKAGYMVEYKYRVGKKYEYEYIFNILPYTEEQRAIIWQEGLEEHGEIWGLDFPDLKMKSSKCSPQNPELLNTNGQNTNQSKTNKTKTKKDPIPLSSVKNNNSDIPILFDDEKEPFQGVNNFAFREFKQEFEEQFPNVFDIEMFQKIYEQMEQQELRIITYQEAVNQVRYMNERQKKGKLKVGDYAAYFVGGIIKKRTSEMSAVLERKLAKAEKEYKAKKEQEAKKEHRPVPFYNWLES
jgi:hypothetical protein